MSWFRNKGTSFSLNTTNFDYLKIIRPDCVQLQKSKQNKIQQQQQKTKQNKTKIKQNKKQNKTKQKTKQNKTKQNKSTHKKQNKTKTYIFPTALYLRDPIGWIDQHISIPLTLTSHIAQLISDSPYTIWHFVTRRKLPVHAYPCPSAWTLQFHVLRELLFNRIRMPKQTLIHLRGVEWVYGLFLFPLVLGKM